jgi:hypothetical protein
MTKATYAHGAVMCFGDIALAVLPLFVIKGLQMQAKQKLSVFGLLALGSVYVLEILQGYWKAR